MDTEIACDAPIEEGDRLYVFFIGDSQPAEDRDPALAANMAIYRQIEPDADCFLAQPDHTAAVGSSGPRAAFRRLDDDTDPPTTTSALHPALLLPANMIIHVYGPALSNPRHQHDALRLAEQMLERHKSEHSVGTRILIVTDATPIDVLDAHPTLSTACIRIGNAHSAATDQALLIARTYFRERAALRERTLAHCTAAFGAVSRELAELRSRVAIEDRMLRRATPEMQKQAASSYLRYTKTSYWRERRTKLMRSITKRLQSA